MPEFKAEMAAKIVDLIYRQTGYHTIACDRGGVIIADSTNTCLGVRYDGARTMLNSAADDYGVTFVTAD
ncbi:MAG: hypothetical protein M0Z41_19765 [Peptococcaceae bacterium]|jgi:sugar diacid utilization regulator|nr:hypothetical protein [Peptococcaceae bacterium]